MNTLYFTKPGLPIDECSVALDSPINGFINPSLNESHREKVASYARDDSGTIVAGILGELSDHQFIIQGLWVNHSMRKHGVGSKLLQLLESYARNKQVKAIVLETTHRELMTFYIKNGYDVITCASMGDRRCTHYVLQKALACAKQTVTAAADTTGGVSAA